MIITKTNADKTKMLEVVSSHKSCLNEQWLEIIWQFFCRPTETHKHTK